MLCLATVYSNWKCSVILVLVIVLRCRGFTVDIRSSTYLDDHQLITCSISSNFDTDDLRRNNVYLHCPFLPDNTMCYINCDNMLVTYQGTPLHTKVFHTCKNIWNNLDRVEYQYLLNNKYIETTGQWYCGYKGKTSSNITIRGYKPPSVTSTTTIVQPHIQETSVAPSSCGRTTECTTQICNVSIIAGTICAFCVSAICNILLAVIVCISRCENRRYKRRHLSKDSYQSPTERMSLFSKHSNRQMELNRSLCSRTPSIDTPSNKESFSTYLQDTIHSTPSKTTSIHMLPDQTYRIIEFLPRNQVYSVDHSGVLPRNHSEDIHSTNETLQPSVHLRQFDGHRRSAQLSYGNYSTHDSAPHLKPNITGRSFNSHQQLNHDSNEESGLGSELLYQTQNLSAFNSRGNKIDLISDCSINDISNRTSQDA